MSAESSDAFETELRRMVERYRREFELTYAEAVGMLTIVSHRLVHELIRREEGQ